MYVIYISQIRIGLSAFPKTLLSTIIRTVIRSVMTTCHLKQYHLRSNLLNKLYWNNNCLL